MRRLVEKEMQMQNCKLSARMHRANEDIDEYEDFWVEIKVKACFVCIARV